jgi:hypothetical protein
MCSRVSGQTFMIALWLGIGTVALWAYLRLARLKPAGLRLAMAHVVVSFALLLTGPFLVRASMHSLPVPLSVVVAIALVTVPLGAYVFLSWIWLLASIRDGLDSTPRGGLPTRTKA